MRWYRTKTPRWPRWLHGIVHALEGDAFDRSNPTMMSSGWLVLLAECFFTPTVALRQCVLFSMVIAVCGACTTRVEEVSDSHRGPSASVLLLVDRWHAGVAIRTSDIPGDLMPERRDFPEAEYLEFGWGDWDFYQASVPILSRYLPIYFKKVRQASLFCLNGSFTSTSTVIIFVKMSVKPTVTFSILLVRFSGFLFLDNNWVVLKFVFNT